MTTETDPNHLHAINHPGHELTDLDPLVLAQVMLADPEVAAAVLSQLRWSNVLTHIVSFSSNPEAAAFAATEAQERILAVRLAVAREGGRRAARDEQNPKTMAPEK
jgi:hypothetical protein